MPDRPRPGVAATTGQHPVARTRETGAGPHGTARIPVIGPGVTRPPASEQPADPRRCRLRTPPPTAPETGTVPLPVIRDATPERVRQPGPRLVGDATPAALRPLGQRDATPGAMRQLAQRDATAGAMRQPTRPEATPGALRQAPPPPHAPAPAPTGWAPARLPASPVDLHPAPVAPQRQAPVPHHPAPHNPAGATHPGRPAAPRPSTAPAPRPIVRTLPPPPLPPVADPPTARRRRPIRVALTLLAVAGMVAISALPSVGGETAGTPPVAGVYLGDDLQQFQVADDVVVTDAGTDLMSGTMPVIAPTWVLPIGGELRDGFGPRLRRPVAGVSLFHRGQDIGGGCGAAIHAVAAGVVQTAQWWGTYGNWVLIDHENGVETGYGHLQRMVVTPGQRVKVGQVIGYEGSTGASTGCHLHLEVHLDGVAVNPVPFFQARGIPLG